MGIRAIVGAAVGVSILGAAVLLTGSLPASAQMMGGGDGMTGMMPMMNMMGGMMGGAAGPAAAGCPGMAAEPIAAGQAPAYERPWISFALAHPKELGLSAEQVTGLTTLRDAFQKEAVRLGQEIRDGEAALAKLYAQTPIDLTAVEVKIKEIAVKEGELRLGRIKTLDKGLALLTAEQRQKLFEAARGPGRMMGAFQPPAAPGQQ